MQYYLELKPQIPELFFESCAFPDASKQLLAIAKQLGIRGHFEFFSFAAQNDLAPPEYQETAIPWHDAQAGIDWLTAMMDQIRSHPESVSDSEELLREFAQCRGVLEQAKLRGSKWHFAMDI